jgi:hypothetical protein
VLANARQVLAGAEHATGSAKQRATLDAPAAAPPGAAGPVAADPPTTDEPPVAAEPVAAAAPPATDEPPTAVDLPDSAGQPVPASTSRGYRRPGRDLSKLPREEHFLPGDNVFVHSMKRRGIVATEEDQYGNVEVVVSRVRHSINHKRLTMTGKREDLYPDLESYDLDIVLLTKDDRKLARQMEKKHVEGAERIIRKGSDDR